MSLHRRVVVRIGVPVSLVMGAFLVATTAPALAAPLPNASREVRITARDEQLERLLGEIFRLVDVPAVLSPRLTGQTDRKVNGDFAQPADMLLQELARTYQFVTYYDGSVMHIVTPTELTTRTFPLAPGAAKRVMDQARELQMTDGRNTLRASNSGSLAASGVPRFVQQIEELSRQQPRPPEPPPAAASVPARQVTHDFRVFYLRYAWAQDTTVNFAGRQTVIPGVANILRSLVDLKPIQTGRWRGPSSTVPPMRGMRDRDLLRDREYIVLPRETPAMQVAQALMETGMLAEASPPTMSPGEVAQAAVGPRIEADPRLNAVIVRDTPDQMPKYQQLIAALDVQPQSLEIEATIIDIDTERARDLGIEWRYNRGLNSVGFGRGSDVGLRGRDDPTNALNTASGFASAILGNRNPFVVRITALQQEKAAKVVSSPQVVTLSNVEAVFDDSRTFYTKVAGQYGGDLFNVAAGTSLRVTPHVFKDEGGAIRIKLLVQVEDGALGPNGPDGLPVVKRSALNTQALIGEGESLLIGGMVRDESETGENKVPGLGDIPVLGNLFKTTSRGGSRIERLFLITPRLVSSQGTRSARERANQPVSELPKPPMNETPAAPPAVSAPAPAPEPKN